MELSESRINNVKALKSAIIQRQYRGAALVNKELFKPEYIGKMNFYLSALDEYIKQPHEQPSIRVILCKKKKNKVAEFSFRDFSKTIGVATYKTSTVLPAAYKGVLPDVETLKKLMD